MKIMLGMCLLISKDFDKMNHTIKPGKLIHYVLRACFHKCLESGAKLPQMMQDESSLTGKGVDFCYNAGQL